MLKIIVVDDEELIRKGLVKALAKQTEFQVLGEAVNGLEAMELIRQELPDVVITDVKMPHMNGVELVKRLEQDFPEIKRS